MLSTQQRTEPALAHSYTVSRAYLQMQQQHCPVPASIKTNRGRTRLQGLYGKRYHAKPKNAEHSTKPRTETACAQLSRTRMYKCSSANTTGTSHQIMGAEGHSLQALIGSYTNKGCQNQPIARA